MLTRLHIRNYAIISKLDVELENGLTILTGETGAGKSILVGALSLVLGKRADSSTLFDKDEKCVVEATFKIDGLDLQGFFDENDLDLDNPTILRREINASGKSRAFVNDTPVNLVQLKALASRLIDIHSQHEVLTLKSADFRLRLLDICSDKGQLVSEYRKAYTDWSKIKQQVDLLKETVQKAAADQDYLQFQLNELEELNVKEGELVESQEKLSLLENAEEINGTLTELSNALLHADDALVDSLRKAETVLNNLGRKYPRATEWANRVKQNLIDIEDVANEMEQSTTSVEFDAGELSRLEERVDEIMRLLTKHRKQSENELVEFQVELEAKLNAISNSDEELTLLNGKLEESESVLQKVADKLSSLRTSEAEKLAPIITAELQTLGMPDAQLAIRVQHTERTANGQDRVEILFTSNKGQALQDISKVASGGELSRLMLAVKAEMARNTQLPAIIFDEVDTGVSGDVADKMGDKIRVLCANMQVVCITHLPQVASKADKHIHVLKEEQEGRTVTGLRYLDKSDRIVEIAKMLSNAKPTEAALQHAKNLVEQTN